MAARRRILAARFADGCVRDPSRFPPEILLFGASVSQGGEVMLRGPAVHIDTDLGDQPERAVGAEARQCGEVDPTTQREQGGTDLERRCVVLSLTLGTRFARSRQVPSRRFALGLKRVDARLDLLVTALDRLVVAVVHLELLAQHEEVFIAIVTRERGGDLGFRRLAPGVAMTSEHRGIGHAGHHVAQDQHPGDPGPRR